MFASKARSGPIPLPLGDWEPVPWGSLSLNRVVWWKWVVGLAPGAAWAVGLCGSVLRS